MFIYLERGWKYGYNQEISSIFLFPSRGLCLEIIGPFVKVFNATFEVKEKNKNVFSRNWKIKRNREWGRKSFEQSWKSKETNKGKLSENCLNGENARSKRTVTNSGCIFHIYYSIFFSLLTFYCDILRFLCLFNVHFFLLSLSLSRSCNFLNIFILSCTYLKQILCICIGT